MGPRTSDHSGRERAQGGGPEESPPMWIFYSRQGHFLGEMGNAVADRDTG